MATSSPVNERCHTATPNFFSLLPSDAPALTRGYVSVSSPKILSFASSVFSAHPEIPPSLHSAHITLLSKDEFQLYCKSSSKSRDETFLEKIDTKKIYPLGVINKGNTWFIPVLWNAGNIWRMKNELGAKEFHITLSRNDDHNIDKSIYSLRHSGFIEKISEDEAKESAEERMLVNGVSIPKSLDLEILDQFFLYSQLRNDESPLQLSWAEHIINCYPDSERGYLRLAEISFRNERWKLAIIAYHAAFTRSSSNEDKDGKRREYYKKKIVSCGKHTEFESIFSKDELTFINQTISSSSVRAILLSPWDSNTGLKLPKITPSRSVDPRRRYVVPSPSGDFQTLPRFFSWIIPFYLAGMSTPRSEDDISLLSHAANITLVITLTLETPLPSNWFSAKIRNIHIPIENNYPPTVHQTDFLLSLLISEPFRNPKSPGRTLLHCGGGKGRLGTVLACYLSLFGFTPPSSPDFGVVDKPPNMTAKNAVEIVRNIRPGSIETSAQEKFVKTYVSLVWKRYGEGVSLIETGGETPEPQGYTLEIQGKIEDPDFIFLIGLPGSGKSAFANMCKIRNKNATIISPDSMIFESVSTRKACEDAVGKFRRGRSRDGRNVLIVDGCNLEKAERAEWRKLFAAKGKAVAVFFEYDQEICRLRAEGRDNHPTLPPRKAAEAIERMKKYLEIPDQLNEGWDGMVRIKGTDNARELANIWFKEPGLKKFIRTKHLLELGGATRDDLVIPPQDLQTRYLHQRIHISEKLDGANLGLSLSSTIPPQILVQNRSHYITPSAHPQFSKLSPWLSKNSPALHSILNTDPVLSERYVLYGEWLTAVHSVVYSSLPDWFLAFDIYDRLHDQFLTRREVEARLDGSGIGMVPAIYTGVFRGEEQLLKCLERKSRFGEGRLEGIVVRFEDLGRGGGERGKIVRGDFIEDPERHWGKEDLRWNSLARNEGVFN